MGKALSDNACSNLMGFLFTWHAERLGWEVSGARGVSREELGLKEGENDLMNEILNIEESSGVWRVEVRLPDGTRTVVSSPESFQAAMTKARKAEEGTEPA